MPKNSKNENYWDSYYSNISRNNQKTTPSQFAVFCLSEIQDQGIEGVIEFGSGNGRDAIFFSEYGLNVIATDNSAKSIENLKKNTTQYKNIQIFHYDISTDSKDIFKSNNKSTCIYARFFIHALEVGKVKNFFKNCTNILRTNELMFLEYRNQKDKDLKKVTKPHFREFYDPEFINKIANKSHFKLIYEVSGKGYAKWKVDDANVTRQIFKKV